MFHVGTCWAHIPTIKTSKSLESMICSWFVWTNDNSKNNSVLWGFIFMSQKERFWPNSWPTIGCRLAFRFCWRLGDEETIQMEKIKWLLNSTDFVCEAYMKPIHLQNRELREESISINKLLRECSEIPTPWKLRFDGERRCNQISKLLSWFLTGTSKGVFVCRENSACKEKVVLIFHLTHYSIVWCNTFFFLRKK